MLTRSSLTIRLHPNDDVVIARAQLVGGTNLLDEKITVSGLVPPGHKVATRAIKAGEPVRRYNQIIGFASRDIAPGEHVHCTTSRWARSSATTRSARTPADAVRDAGRDVRRHRPRRRPGRHAQLHRHPVDGELLGHGRARHRRPLHARARWPRFPTSTASSRSPTASGCGMDTHGEGMQLLRRTLGGYARHANFAGVLMIGLGCEANQISSLLGAEKLERRATAADASASRTPAAPRKTDRARHRR